MATQFHVNGLATLTVNVGSGEEILGYSTDGVTIEVNYEVDDVFTDRFGSKLPEDVMNLGQWANVKCSLIKYDNEVLEKIQTRLSPSLGNFGELPNIYSAGTVAIGALMGQCNNMFILTVNRGTTCTEVASGAFAEGAYQFNAAYLADTDSFKVGTIVTQHDLTFRCLPDASGVLFDKV